MMKEELNVDIYMKVAVNICNTQHAIGHELGYLKLSRDSTGAVTGEITKEPICFLDAITNESQELGADLRLETVFDAAMQYGRKIAEENPLNHAAVLVEYDSKAPEYRIGIIFEQGKGSVTMKTANIGAEVQLLQLASALDELAASYGE